MTWRPILCCLPKLIKLTPVSSILFYTLPPMLLPLHCLFILLFRKWLGSLGTFYASIIVFLLLNCVTVYTIAAQLIYGQYIYIDFGSWFVCLNLIDSHLAFCSDILSNCASLLVLFLTPLALYFGVEYMFREAFANRLLYLLNLFAASVILLFYAYDFFLILLFWECVGLFSLLLVNFYSTRIYTLKAAFKTFVFSRLSDMFLFGAFLLAINVFHSCDLAVIFIQIPFLSIHYVFLGSFGIHFLTLLAGCIALGGVIKCAQFGFHVWLPDAMEAPTPASALIHSSTLVVAGVFLIIRFSLLFEFAYYVNLGLALLGSTTLAFSAVAAVFQQDIKKLVAYSTISQIGYLVCGCGFGCYDETLIYLIIHAVNKAFLFILVGYTVHLYSGNTDLRFMGGSHVFSFDVAVMFLVLGANLSGLPYLAGFAGKEFLISQFLLSSPESLYIRACWQVAFVFTPIYMFILIVGVVYGPLRSRRDIWRSLTSSQRQTLFANSSFRATSSFRTNYNSLYLSLSNSWILAGLSSLIFSSLLIFIMSIGEYLLLILIDYSSLTPVVTQNVWISHSSHLISNLTAYSISTFNLVMSSIMVSFVGVYRYLTSLNRPSRLGLLQNSLYVDFSLATISFLAISLLSTTSLALFIIIGLITKLILRVYYF